MTEQEWLASTDPLAMLEWHLQFPTGVASSARWRGEPPYPSDRKLRLFACACVRQVWDKLTDERSRRAVEVAERFADGLATEAECRAAFTAVNFANFPNSNIADIEAVYCAIVPMDGSVYNIDPRVVPLATQATLLRDIFGNPFRPVSLPKEHWRPRLSAHVIDRWVSHCPWLTPNVLAVAETIYRENRWDELPILADALWEAGCRDETILAHCRGTRVKIKMPCAVCKGVGYLWEDRLHPIVPFSSDIHLMIPSPQIKKECYVCLAQKHILVEAPCGPHARGCHVVDLILGKELKTQR